MASDKNLADPAYEPTDAELIELSTRAFAGVGAELAANQREMRRRIALERDRILRVLAERGRVP